MDGWIFGDAWMLLLLSKLDLLVRLYIIWTTAYCFITPVVVKYEVMVHTGKKRGAGTDANVFITIFGERGDTGLRPLRSSKTNRNKFENGKVCRQW